MLEIIKDNQRGKPRDKVNIRCLDKLNVYGFSPKRLMKIIKINKVESDVDKPFNIFVCVRSSCNIIFILISMNITFIWLVFQYKSCEIKINISDRDSLICDGK